jgi:hypothetical protein
MIGTIMGDYHAGGNNKGKSLLNGNIDINNFVAGHDNIGSGGRSEGMREIHPHRRTQFLLDFPVGSAGDKTDAVDAPTGIFHKDNPFKTLRFIVKKAVRDTLDSLVDASDERDSSYEMLPEFQNPISDITRSRHAGKQDEQNRKDRTQTGNMKAKNNIGLTPERNYQKKLVHGTDDKKEDVDRQAGGNYYNKTCQKKLLHFLFKHSTFTEYSQSLLFTKRSLIFIIFLKHSRFAFIPEYVNIFNLLFLCNDSAQPSIMPPSPNAFIGDPVFEAIFPITARRG